MKRRFIIALALVFVLSLCFSCLTLHFKNAGIDASADGPGGGQGPGGQGGPSGSGTQGQTCITDSQIADIIKGKLTDNEKRALFDPQNYDTTMRGKDIRELPLLKIYRYYFWSDAGLGLKGMIAKAEELSENSFVYTCFDGRPYDIAVTKSGSSFSVKSEGDIGQDCGYVKAVIELKKQLSLLGKDCVVSDIYCFDFTVFDSVLFLETDNGTYAVYCENGSEGSDPIILTEAEFGTVGKAFYDYIESKGWGAEGDQMNGGAYSFRQFYSELSETAIGDINNDGDVDSLDANMANKFDAGIINLTDDQIKAGDVNGDGEVDSLDANLINKYDAGIISEFPVPKK